MLVAWPEGEWTRTPTTLAPRDVLVLYTDGVTDATSDGERYGDERLAATLAESRDAGDGRRRTPARPPPFRDAAPPRLGGGGAGRRPARGGAPPAGARHERARG